MSAGLVIFVDASAAIPPGELRLERITTRDVTSKLTTHSLNPQHLPTLAQELCQAVPERAFLLAIGGASFEHGGQLSTVVRRVIPSAGNQIKALLSDVSLPLSEALPPRKTTMTGIAHRTLGNRV